MKTLCFVSFVVILTTIMVGCTKNNNYYYYAYCSKFDEKKEQCVEWMTCVKLDTKNGDCEEWKKTDKDPFVENDDSSLSDNDIENKDDEIDIEETDDFIFEDSDEIPDESPELGDFEEKDDAVPDNDVDAPEDVCFYIKKAATMDTCYIAEDDEKIFITTQKKSQCEAVVESNKNGYRFYYGVELPFYNEDKSSSLDAADSKINIDGKEFSETPC